MSESRYKISIDFEHDSEWSVGVVPGEDVGQSATTEEVATILELVATLLRQGFQGFTHNVRYPSREQAEP